MPSEHHHLQQQGQDASENNEPDAEACASEVQPGRPSPSLLSLPSEILRHVMTFATLRTLAALSETNRELHNLATADNLWRELTRRRFRLSPRPGLPRRIALMGGVCWRTLYANWHRQMRMPLSRHSGPTFKAFARATDAQVGVAVWMTVVSAEDCRLRRGVLRVHFVVQNVAACGRDGVLTVLGDGVGVRVGGGVGVVAANIDGFNDGPAEVDGEGEGGGDGVHRCTVALRPTGVEELVLSGRDRVSSRQWKLGLDEFVVLPLEVKIAGTEVEVDALERIEEVRVPVAIDGKRITVRAPVSQKAIWDAYDLLPGGWWARVG